MCQCNPWIKTPWCGQGDCNPTKEQQLKVYELVETLCFTKEELEGYIKVLTNNKKEDIQ